MSRLFFRSILVLAACNCAVFAADAPPATPAPAATPKPGLLSRTWDATKKLNPVPTIKKLNPFHHKNEAEEVGKSVAAQYKGLILKMTLDPAAPNLGEHKQIVATLRLQNTGKKLVQLEFPTTQRIEVLVKNSIGKVVEQWSEDQAFQNEPTLVTINPGERVEYTANLSTRDFAAGEEYTISAFLPNYEMLRSIVKVVPTR